MPRKLIPAAVLLVCFVMALACTRAAPGSKPWRPASTPGLQAAAPEQNNPPAALPENQRAPGAPILTSTPDPMRVLPTPRMDPEEYIVKPNDTLGQIAQLHGVALAKLIEENQITNPDLLEPGQVLTIPPADPQAPGPDFKVIPDSELVYGPASSHFDVAAFINEQNGYLNHYQGEMEGVQVSGADIVLRVALDYSVNPRLLLAVLEYRSGWVTNPNPPEESLDYPILYSPQRKGLYLQLTWTANNLNRGFYLWRVNGVPGWILLDGNVIPASPVINAGTAGVQELFSLLMDQSQWEEAVTENGLIATYTSLFGYPFDLAVEPLLPPDLTQPTLQLPFEDGARWAFTGGPHGGWADGSAWAAIDFAPPGEPLGCVQNEAWVAAAADGMIVRTGNGEVIQDLDGDGLEQTGWVVFYMHVESRDRVAPGTYLHAGDRIGHPSCEGGVSTGTHLHLARRYNGEWISADGTLPFNLDGWISKGDGAEYNGFLVKDGVVVEALEGQRTENQIGR